MNATQLKHRRREQITATALSVLMLLIVWLAYAQGCIDILNPFDGK